MIKKIINKWDSFIKKNKTEIKQVTNKVKVASGAASANLPTQLQENRRTLWENIIRQRDRHRNGEITAQQFQKDMIFGFKFLDCFDEEKQKELMRYALEEEGITKNSDFTNNEFDTYEKIISYIHRNRQGKIKALLRKAATKINDQNLSISKRTIDFITSITDEELATLKEIFRYVVGNGILRYKNIEQDFMSKGFCQTGSDNIKFLGNVFINQDAIGGKAYNNKVEAVKIDDIFIWKCLIPLIASNGINFTEETLMSYLSIEENKSIFKKFLETYSFKLPILDKEQIIFYITKQPTNAGLIEPQIGCFTILTDVGLEMYSLLKDEIENYPDEYLKSVAEDEKYKNFGLTYDIINNGLN